MRSKFLQAALLFIYGGLYDLLVWRIFVHWFYRKTDPSFTNHPLTNATVAIFGGISVCVFMMFLIIRVRRPIGSLAMFFKTTWVGLIATIVSFQGFLLALSFYVGGLWFFLAFIDVETYGLVLLAFSIPFGLVCGALAGAMIAFLFKAPVIHRIS